MNNDNLIPNEHKRKYQEMGVNRTDNVPLLKSDYINGNLDPSKQNQENKFDFPVQQNYQNLNRTFCGFRMEGTERFMVISIFFTTIFMYCLIIYVLFAYR